MRIVQQRDCTRADLHQSGSSIHCAGTQPIPTSALRCPQSIRSPQSIRCTGTLPIGSARLLEPTFRLRDPQLVRMGTKRVAASGSSSLSGRIPRLLAMYLVLRLGSHG